MRLRKHRFKTLGRFMQTDQLLKSAVGPALLYPTPVYGLANQRLKQMRTFIATLSGWGIMMCIVWDSTHTRTFTHTTRTST